MKTKTSSLKGEKAAGSVGDERSTDRLPPVEKSSIGTSEQQGGHRAQCGATEPHEPGVNDTDSTRALKPVENTPVPAPAPPFDKSLLAQLSFTAQGGRTDETVDDRTHGAITLYQSFAPADAVESVLARLGVALANASMDSLDRAARPGQSPAARQVEVKLGVQSATAVTGLMAQLDKHRGLGRQDLRVGNVNVGSGGRAIVGTVHPSRASMKEPAATQEDEVLVAPEEDSEAA